MSPSVVLALVSAACASPAPDADAYVRALVEAQRRHEQRLASYAYEVVETREDLDRDGRVERRRTRGYEVVPVQGRLVRRLISRDGIPLPPAERTIREETESRSAESAQRRTVNVSLSRILERYLFQSAGSETVDGRCALVFDFAARPGDFKLQRDFVLRKLAGRLWVDEQEQAIVRLDARNTGGVRILLGIAAKITTANLHAEFARLEPGVWLPRVLEGSVEGRKLLFVGFSVRERLEFARFRRLDAGQAPPAAPPARR